MHTALRVASIPREEFEALVESDDPPTVTKLAERGTKRSKTRRKHWKKNVDPLFLKISEAAAMMDTRSPKSIVAETRAQFDSGVGMDIAYIERLEFVRDWLTSVIEGSRQFVVSCSTNLED